MINRFRHFIYRKKKELLYPLRRTRLGTWINSIDDPRAIQFLCDSCGEIAPGMTYHGGFSDISAFYCSSCHAALYLRGATSEPQLPDTRSILSCDWGREEIPLWSDFEAQLPPCPCGGLFRYLNPPRCPKCHGPLSGDIYEGKPVLKARDYYVLDFGRTYSVEELRKVELAG